MVARCLAETNVKVFALGSADRTALKYSRRKETYWTVPEAIRNSPKLLIGYIKEKIALTNADVYLPIDEPGHRFAIQHRQELASVINLCPLAGLESFDTLTRKDRLASFLERERIAGPRTVSLGEAGWQESIPNDMAFPLIAKPAQGDGGKGIRMISGVEDLGQFYVDPQRKLYGNYILQEFVRGYDIDCSVLCLDGEIIANTIQLGVVTRQRAYAAAGGVRFLHEPRLLDLVSRVIKHARFSGIAHVDARYDAECDSFKIIEVNARYWGSLTASLHAGVNFPYLALQLALRNDFPSPNYVETKYIDFLTYARSLVSFRTGNGSDGFRIVDSDLKHFTRDPIAEVANIMLRRARQSPRG